MRAVEISVGIVEGRVRQKETHVVGIIVREVIGIAQRRDVIDCGLGHLNRARLAATPAATATARAHRDELFAFAVVSLSRHDVKGIDAASAPCVSTREIPLGAAHTADQRAAAHRPQEHQLVFASAHDKAIGL